MSQPALSLGAVSPDRLRAARRALEWEILAQAAADRKRFGSQAANESLLLKATLLPLQAWAEDGWSHPDRLVTTLSEGFREPLTTLLMAHATRARAHRPRRSGNVDAPLHELGGPAVFVDFVGALVASLTALDTGWTGGLAGRLSLWASNVRLELRYDVSSTDATLRHAVIVEHRRQRERLQKLKHEVIAWRSTRALSLPERWRLIDDGSTNSYIVRDRAPTSYRAIHERVKFYWWAYELLSRLGHEVRWPLAAAIVAEGSHAVVDTSENAELAAKLLGSMSNTLEAALRTASQVIFDDVVPKLALLIELGMLDGPLVDQDAISWDALTLSEEQHLIQPLYESMREEDVQDFYDIARKGPAASAYQSVFGGGTFEAGRYHKGGEIPPFIGSKDEFTQVLPRWKYGLEVGSRFSTLGVSGSVGNMPAVGSKYQDGSALKVLDVHRNLHLLASVLDDAGSVSSDTVSEIVGRMSPLERTELASDRVMLEQLRTELGQDFDRLRRMMSQ